MEVDVCGCALFDDANAETETMVTARTCQQRQRRLAVFFLDAAFIIVQRLLESYALLFVAVCPGLSLSQLIAFTLAVCGSHVTPFFRFRVCDSWFVWGWQKKKAHREGRY